MRKDGPTPLPMDLNDFVPLPPQEAPQELHAHMVFAPAESDLEARGAPRIKHCYRACMPCVRACMRVCGGHVGEWGWPCLYCIKCSSEEAAEVGSTPQPHPFR